MVTRLKMGQKFDKTAVSKTNYSSSGRTWTVLNAFGKQHSQKRQNGQLAMWARTGAKTLIN